MAPVDNAAAKKGKKQANFSNIEIEQIARSWLACSGNSINGAQQKSDVYWTKIEQHFQKSMAEFRRKYPGVVKNVPRSIRSLSSKWGELNHDCAKFSGAMSTIVEFNESGTNEDEQMEKARALYQQTHKKGLEFSYEGAWKILKDSPKWQIAARMQEKHLERVLKRKNGKQAANTPADVESPDKDSGIHAGTPEMVTDRPLGNKKAKELAAIERKATKTNSALAESTSLIAAALNRRAKAMESVFEIQLFQVNLGSLDDRARNFVLLKREAAEAELRKQLKEVEPFRKEVVELPPDLPKSVADQENQDPEAWHSPDNESWHEESNEELEELALHQSGHSNPINLSDMPDRECENVGVSSEEFSNPTFHYQDVQSLYQFM